MVFVKASLSALHPGTSVCTKSRWNQAHLTVIMLKTQIAIQAENNMHKADWQTAASPKQAPFKGVPHTNKHCSSSMLGDVVLQLQDFLSQWIKFLYTNCKVNAKLRWCFVFFSSDSWISESYAQHQFNPILTRKTLLLLPLVLVDIREEEV